MTGPFLPLAISDLLS